MTHGPSSGNKGGILFNGNDAGRGRQEIGEKTGCSELSKAIERVKPLVHVFGHIHESYGVYKSGETTCINASNLDLRYNAVNSPIVFDIVFQNAK